MIDPDNKGDSISHDRLKEILTIMDMDNSE
jgi:hypothetical protein